MDDAGMVALVVFILIIVAAIAYGVGYLWSRVESLNQSHVIEAEWRLLPRDSPILAWWRRVAGWAAYMLAALWLGVFLALAYWHAYRGWTYLMAAWVVWFAIFLGVIWLAEWCWKPNREAPKRPPVEENSP